MSSWAIFFASHGFISMTVGQMMKLMILTTKSKITDGILTIIEEYSLNSLSLDMDENSFVGYLWVAEHLMMLL